MKLFEWLFKYPLADYQHGTLVFTSGWPAPLLLAAWGLGGALLLWLLFRRGRLLSVPRVAALGALQLAMWALVLLVLWQPALLLRSLRAGENSVAVMLDTSASMNFPDDGVTRMQQAENILNSPSLRTLQRDYELRRYVFGANAGKVDDFAALPAPQPHTAVADSLLQVLQQSRTAPLGAVVLISDGADNGGNLDPERLAEIAGYGVPVHAVGLGRERIPEDLELDEVLLPGATLPDTTVSARVAIRHDGAGTARVKVVDGDKLLAAREVPLPDDSGVTTAWLDIAARDAGDRELQFIVDGKQGETELRNNSRVRMLQVAAEPASILYVEGEPRWEYKFIRRALTDERSVRLLSLLRTTTNGLYRQGVQTQDELQTGFPDDKKTLFRYDALILGNVQAAWFSPQQQQLIADFVSERGGSLLMLGGSKGLGEGGWQNTPVAEILPASLPADGSFHRLQAPVELTARGRAAALLKLGDTDNDKAWAGLPALADYQDLGALKPAATRLLDIKVKERRQPLLVVQNYGRGRAYLLATGGTWRWQMSLPREDQRHEGFWRQLARGLAAAAPQQFELSAEARADRVQLRAEVRDQAFELQRDVVVSAVATGATGETTSIDLKPVLDQPGVYQADYRPAASGSLFVHAIARRGDRPVAEARTAVHYDSGRAEYFSLRQNRALLQQLAAGTGGAYYSAATLDDLPQAIRFSPAGVTQQETRPLWDLPAIFVLLVALKAAEWLLRRRWRIV